MDVSSDPQAPFQCFTSVVVVVSVGFAIDSLSLPRWRLGVIALFCVVLFNLKCLKYMQINNMFAYICIYSHTFSIISQLCIY